jgi:hypothetical protein
MAQGSIRGGQPLEFADTGPSRRLWAECPWDDIGQTVKGVKFYDDFANTPNLSAAAATGKYTCWEDSGTGTLVGSGVDEFGGLIMTGDAADNQEEAIQTGGGTGVLANFIDPAVATPHDVWFECRFQLSALVGNCFFGLMQPFVLDGDAITDSGVLKDTGLVGFSTLEATPTILNFTYKKNGQTVQVPITTVHTMVAATAVSVGFHYRYNANPSARKICVFKNNVLNATGVPFVPLTSTPTVGIQHATFPDGVMMALTAAIKNVTDITASTLHWWKFAMVQN